MAEHGVNVSGPFQRGGGGLNNIRRSRALPSLQGEAGYHAAGDTDAAALGSLLRGNPEVAVSLL